jgi:hypothetical protein
LLEPASARAGRERAAPCEPQGILGVWRVDARAKTHNSIVWPARNLRWKALGDVTALRALPRLLRSSEGIGVERAARPLREQLEAGAVDGSGVNDVGSEFVDAASVPKQSSFRAVAGEGRRRHGVVAVTARGVAIGGLGVRTRTVVVGLRIPLRRA